MMRLHKVPATQFHRDGLVCPDGHPFPNELCSTWNNFLDPSEITLYPTHGEKTPTDGVGRG